MCSTRMECEKLVDLPAVLLLHCLSFLDARSLALAACSAKVLERACGEETLWQACLLRKWDEPQCAVRSWRAEYRTRELLLKSLRMLVMRDNLGQLRQEAAALLAVLASSRACGRTRSTLQTAVPHLRSYLSEMELDAVGVPLFAPHSEFRDLEPLLALQGAAVLRGLCGGQLFEPALRIVALMAFAGAEAGISRSQSLVAAPVYATLDATAPLPEDATIPAAGLWPAGYRPPYDTPASRARREARPDADPSLLSGSWRGLWMPSTPTFLADADARAESMPLRVALTADASGRITGWGSDPLGSFRLTGRVSLACSEGGESLLRPLDLHFQYCHGECGGVDGAFIARVVPGAAPQQWSGYTWPWGLVGAWHSQPTWMEVHEGGEGRNGTFMLWPSA